MRITRFLLLALGCLSIAAFAFAQSPKPSASAPGGTAPASSAPSNPAASQVGAASDPEAIAALDACLKAVGEMPGYEVRFRQESATALPTVAEGRLVVGPKRRVRYELASRQGQIAATMKLVCDGASIWRLDDHAGEREVSTYRLAELEAEKQKLLDVQTALDLEKAKELTSDIDQEHAFRGILPPLEDLKAKIAFGKPTTEEIDIGGAKRAALVLKGEWNKEMKKRIIPPKQEQLGSDGKPLLSAPPAVDPAEIYEKRKGFLLLPRFAVLYLDPQTKLPLRLVWLGPKKSEGPDVTLSRLDWLGLTPQPPEKLESLFALTAEEKGLPAKPQDIKAAMKRRIDALVQQQEREKQMLKGSAEPGKP